VELDIKEYLDWYSEQNGRVVLELEPERIRAIGSPTPWEQAEPVSTQEENDKMARFLARLCTDLSRVNAQRNAYQRRLPAKPLSHWLRHSRALEITLDDHYPRSYHGSQRCVVNKVG